MLPGNFSATMAPKQFTINRRRLTMALAIACPIGIGLGLILGELHWQRHGGAIALPEMCITSTPEGETSVNYGSCEPGPELEI